MRFRLFRAVAFLTVSFVMLSCTASSTEPSQPGSAAAGSSGGLKDIADLMVGRWVGDITFVADYPGVAKKGEKSTTYSTCALIADGKLMECDFYGGQSLGKGTYWWDPASKQVKALWVDSGGNWDQGIVSRQGNKLMYDSAGALGDGQPVQYKGEVTYEDNGNSQINVGATTLAGVRNEYRDTWKRVSK